MIAKRHHIHVMQIVDALEGGGAERIVVELLKHLDRDRFDISVLTSRKPGVYADEISERGIRLYSIARKFRFDLVGFFLLIRLLRQTKPQIIHTHKTGSNTLGRLAAILAGVPVIIAHEHTTPRVSPVQRLVDRFLYNYTTYLIACDHALRSEIAQSSRVYPGKIVVIHNGVDTDRFHLPSYNLYELRKALGLPPGPLVGAFARLVPEKNIENLLKAVPYILRRQPDASLIIVGEGPLRDQLEEKAGELGISERVNFLGFRRDVPDLLRAIDVFASASSIERLPVSILEAMSTEKPVVATSVGGVPEIIKHGITGILVPPDSAEELGESIAGLLADKQLALQMGRAGRQSVESEFSIHAMARKIESLYLSAIPGTCVDLATKNKTSSPV